MTSPIRFKGKLQSVDHRGSCPAHVKNCKEYTDGNHTAELEVELEEVMRAIYENSYLGRLEKIKKSNPRSEEECICRFPIDKPSKNCIVHGSKQEREHNVCYASKPDLICDKCGKKLFEENPKEAEMTWCSHLIWKYTTYDYYLHNSVVTENWTVCPICGIKKPENIVGKLLATPPRPTEEESSSELCDHLRDKLKNLKWEGGLKLGCKECGRILPQHSPTEGKRVGLPEKLLHQDYQTWTNHWMVGAELQKLREKFNELIDYLTNLRQREG